MTPEKRPAEDEEEQESKKLKEDSPPPVTEALQDETSQDSDASDSATSSDPEKKELDLPEERGTLVYTGCTQWEYIGRRNLKSIPSMIHYGPRLISALKGIRVAFVTSHCSAVHSIIITEEGKAMALGRNEKGQLGVGDADIRTGIVPIQSMAESTVVAAAVGRNHSLLLTDRGNVFACGDNKSGQCGTGSTSAIIHTPTKISFKESKICKVACGAEFSMIIDKKGYLYSFGLPEYGQLGHNTDGKFFISCTKLSYQHERVPRRVPIFVERSKDGHPTPVTDVQIVDIACGNNHTVAVDAKKRAFSWGFGGYGRLGHAEPKDEYIPRLIKYFDGHNRGVVKIYCGSTFTVGISVLGIFLWGQTRRTGEANMYPKPLQDLCGWDVRSVGCSATSIVVAADESVISWGPSPTYGELGLGDNIKSSTQPKEVKALEGAHVSQVACGMGHTLMMVRDETEQDKEILEKLKEITL
ncbi:protein RCC2 homolog [Homarus americanus]|uniref:protein RCC2 homolog n=1 Tax=Homarus americanus TaxID=6706 RepID=UPI001C497616|nr:protein RCC2 homolog [Homarus americanus]